MKKSVVLFSLMITVLAIISYSCKKEEPITEPAPAERKKCAWVSGQIDSTGFGVILFSADSGETWVRQAQNLAGLQGVDVIDIWAVDENKVWAIGSKNVILKTINGGQTWTQVMAPTNNANPELMAISVVDKTNIWISGDNGTVYNSTNDGSTWTMFDTSIFSNGGMQGIWAISQQKVFVVGGISGGNERGFIGYTINGGLSWDSVVPENDFNKNEWIGVTAYENTIVVYGRKAHYIVSNDGGTTWTNDSVEGTGGGGGPADINHLVMLNSLTWWGAFDEGQIFITTDGGISWAAQQTDAGGFYLIGLDAWDAQLALVVGTSLSWPQKGPLLKTAIGGNLWERKFLYNSPLTKVTFIKR
ncbi:MAG: hypothetical protein KKA07_02255 [Bacteroidetes bacterium]|nr:hypothetical protein [Bacteroidota bacterium]MBU1717873.1 hypothetical protein [Bacteroidota bacterium]